MIFLVAKVSYLNVLRYPPLCGRKLKSWLGGGRKRAGPACTFNAQQQNFVRGRE